MAPRRNAEPTVTQRGYGIGERAILEDPETERYRAIFWARVKAWAFRPGGKY